MYIDKEACVACLNRIERVLGNIDATPETMAAYEEAVLLVKQIKWHIRDGEPLTEWHGGMST